MRRSPPFGFKSSSIALPSRESFAALVGLSAVAIASSWLLGPQGFEGLGATLAVLLVWASLIDLDRHILPNALTYAILGLGGIAAIFISPPTLLDRLAGALCGYGVLWGVGFWYRKRTGRTGLGLGDAKLLAGLGWWHGALYLPFALLFASSLAIAYVCARRLVDPEAFRRKIPFGPFIALSFWGVWLLGSRFQPGEIALFAVF